MGWYVPVLPRAEIMHLNWWMSRKINFLLKTVTVASVAGSGECMGPTTRSLSQIHLLFWFLFPPPPGSCPLKKTLCLTSERQTWRPSYQDVLFSACSPNLCWAKTDKSVFYGWRTDICYLVYSFTKTLFSNKYIKNSWQRTCCFKKRKRKSNSFLFCSPQMLKTRPKLCIFLQQSLTDSALL